MGVILDSWCFCKGITKTEKMKASIFSGKAPSMALISLTGPNGIISSGTGFLIHRNLLLTTHLNLPSISSAESAEIRLQNGVAASLFPHRFFITSSVIDLTIVGLDITDGDSTTQQIHYLKTCSKPNLDLGNVVYLLGYGARNELKIGEGKLVVATDSLIKLSTDETVWSPGSAGFDVNGNLAFMICDPKKLVKEEDNNKPMKRMQFGIPIPVICDWLNQHWEGSLDEHTTSKPPLIRLLSKSDRSCTSFTMRRVFKPNDDNVETTPSEETNQQHAQGIPTPEIYESPKLTSGPLRIEKSHLLDINFPPKIPKVSTFMSLEDNHTVEEAEIASTGSVNGALSEVISSSPPPEAARGHYVYNNRGYSSEEETMYSAETAESRNYPTPPRKDGSRGQERVGRSQSCVSSSRWATPTPLKSLNGSRREMLEKQRSFVHGTKMVTTQRATSQKSNDYYSPTVSSIMKKRSNENKPGFKPVARPTTRAVNSSSRWQF